MYYYWIRSMKKKISNLCPLVDIRLQLDCWFQSNDSNQLTWCIGISATAIGVLNCFHSSQLACFLPFWIWSLTKKSEVVRRPEKRRRILLFWSVVLPTRKCCWMKGIKSAPNVRSLVRSFVRSFVRSHAHPSRPY